jgi:Rieske 2Fe-2S family protein
MESRSAMSMDLMTRAPGFSLKRDFYTSPAYHALDLEHIFYKEWLFAGHSCEMPRPGDFTTLQVGEYPVILVRGRDGAIRAFHNVCRHRGSRLCTDERGSRPRLVCPYHQWTYDLDGRLIFARDMMNEIDLTQFGLMPVACGEVAGWIFISLAEEPRDFEVFRRMVERYMAPHRLAEAKIAHSSTIIEKGNWKLVMENNRECYHCSSNHPELCRVFSDQPTLATSLNGTEENATGEDARILDHWDRCEAAGLPSRYQISPDAQYRVMRLPFLREAESMTMDGHAAVRRPLADFPTGGLGSMLLYHYPNSWNHLLSDHALSFRILPISPTETEVTTKWLVHKDAVEGVDYDLKALTEVWLATNDEDRRIVEENQRGILSPAYRPGPYSRMHEGAVIQFVDWYADAMSGRLGGGTAAAPIRDVA